MAITIDYDILNDLSDMDIDIICRNIDLDKMLEPIKQNTKYYSKYTQRLGRMDKKSVLVQKNMPKIALDLYHKKDNNFVKLFAIWTMKLKNEFKQIIENDFNKKISLEDLQNYSTEEYITLLAEIENKPGNSVELELFILQAKLNKIAIPESTQTELINEWKYYCKIKQIREDNQSEKEHLIKQQEAIAIKQLKDQKQYYENLIFKAGEIKKILEQNIEDKQKFIITLEQEVDSQKEEVKKQCIDNSKKTKIIEELNEKIDFLKRDNKELQKNLGEQKEVYKEQIKKEWENRNFELLRIKKELEDSIFDMRSEFEELTEKKKELEVSLDCTQKIIDTCMSNMKEQFTNKVLATTNEAVSMPNIGRQSYQYELSDVPNLYITNGNRDIDAETCKTIDDFQNILESNLGNIGCKMKSYILGDSFNASINVGLIPLLCGFGTRKAAFSLIAARFAEEPTVICIPNGFSSIRKLEDAIKNAPTISVVIEDLFGKMTENIILPIIKNNTEKQLVFCCEDANNLKYLDKYYYNYFQLISVNCMSNKNTWKLIYGDADEVLQHVEYDNKSVGHKLVRYLLNEVGVADTYIITRGNMLTYMIEEMEHCQDEVLQIWIKQELSQVLSKEQKEKVIEIIENNETKFGRNLLEGL